MCIYIYIYVYIYIHIWYIHTYITYTTISYIIYKWFPLQKLMVCGPSSVAQWFRPKLQVVQRRIALENQRFSVDRTPRGLQVDSGCMDYVKYPPVVKHGLLENGPFINDFSSLNLIKPPLSSGIFQPCLMKPEGKSMQLCYDLAYFWYVF